MLTAPGINARRPLVRKRFLIAAFVVVVPTCVLMATVGWPSVNQTLKLWAHKRLVARLEAHVASRPEIADYAALRQQEVRGTNGWPHIREASRRLGEMDARLLAQHLEGNPLPVQVSDIARAFEDAKEPGSDALGGIAAEKYQSVLDDTAAVVALARLAAACDCLVQTDLFLDPRATHVNIPDVFGVLATRVVILDRLGRAVEVDDEMRLLVKTLSLVCARGSKDWATTWLRTRNHVLEYCVMPILNRRGGQASRPEWLKALRWHTPGNDAKLWRNNAAAIYCWLRWSVDSGEIWFPYGQEPRTPDFPDLDLAYIPAYTELLDVVVANAEAARSGELDLRDEDWVESYHFDFMLGWHPINGVVGCGHETMNRLVAEIKREDRLWAEIQAPVPTP